MSAKLLEMKVILRPAEMWDLFHNGLNKRLGQPFWIRSTQTNKFDNRCYLIDRSTNAMELKSWAEQGMIFVPVSDIEMKQSKPSGEKPVAGQDLNWNPLIA